MLHIMRFCVDQRPFSHNRTLTVGSGITPDLLSLPTGRRPRATQQLIGSAADAITAGGDFHPALRSRLLAAGVRIITNAKLKIDTVKEVQ